MNTFLSILVVFLGLYSSSVLGTLLSVCSTTEYSNNGNWIKIWESIGLKFVLFLSMMLNITLLLCGSKRKYKTDKWLKFSIWILYQTAVILPGFALGMLSRDPRVDDMITLIWVGFLLCNLGGVDTITGYSSDDLQSWDRYLLNVIYQFCVGTYIVLRSWKNNPMIFAVLLLLIVAVIKNGERIYALRLASVDGFRNHVAHPPNAGPDYPSFMQLYDHHLKAAISVEVEKGITGDLQGNISIEEIKQKCGMKRDTYRVRILSSVMHNKKIPDSQVIYVGFNLLRIVKSIFSGITIGFEELETSKTFFNKAKFTEAFKVVEIELGWLYDILYTKSIITQSKIGMFLKCFTFCSIVASLITFVVLKPGESVDKDIDKNEIITFLLYSCLIFIELCSFILSLLSDWFMLKMSKYHSSFVDCFYTFLSFCQILVFHTHRIRWSNNIFGFSIFDFCLKAHPVRLCGIEKVVDIYRLYLMYRNIERAVIDDTLKELIFDHIRTVNEEGHKEFGWVLDSYGWDFDKKLEFDHCVLLWHIATNICFASDYEDNRNVTSAAHNSKMLSDYMLYLLVFCPSVLPEGVGKIRFDDTCAELEHFLKQSEPIRQTSVLCKQIIGVNTEVQPSEVKGDVCKSVLFDGSILAKSLQILEQAENWSRDKKWRMVSEFWIEIVCYAAGKSRGMGHGKMLSEGGELITHIWLLMGHMGIINEYMICKGEANKEFIEDIKLDEDIELEENLLNREANTNQNII